MDPKSELTREEFYSIYISNYGSMYIVLEWHNNRIILSEMVLLYSIER